MSPELRWEVFYPHTADRVWKAITEPEALRAWLQPEDDVVEYRLIHASEGRRVSYFWKGRDRDAVVSFDLAVAEGGVHLQVRMDACFTASLDSLTRYLNQSISDPSGHLWVGFIKGAHHGNQRFPAG